MKRQMDVYFHGEPEGIFWRGQVIGTDGALKARTADLQQTQERAIEQVREQWFALQRQLQAVAA